MSEVSAIRWVRLTEAQRDGIEEACRYIAQNGHDVTLLASVVSAFDEAPFYGRHKEGEGT